MKVILKMSIFVYALGSFSCSEKIDPTSKDLQPLWEYDFKLDKTAVIYPIVMDDQVIYSSFTEENGRVIWKSKLLALEQESGELKWEWFNNHSPKSDVLDIFTPTFLINNKLYFSTGPRIYSVNAIDGSTFWYNVVGDYTFDNIGFSGEILSINAGYDGDGYTALKEIDLETGSTTDLLQIKRGNGIDNLGSSFIIEPDFIYYWQSYKSGKPFPNDYIFLFNKHDRKAGKLVYSKNADSLGIDESVQYMKEYDKESIIFIGIDRIGKLSKNTGDLLWLFDTGINTFQNTLEIGEAGEIYYINQNKLFCMDGQTGKPIWIKDYDFTYDNSKIIFRQGYLYLICGSRFNIFSAHDGSLVSSVYPPVSPHSSDSDKFQPVISIDKENGRVYTASYSKAYCYPTYDPKTKKK